MIFIEEIRFCYLRAFLAFQLLSKAYSIQCYYYPNYPLLESPVQVNCKSSCCNGYPETEATTCCYVSKATTPWYIYLIIILIAAISAGFMILAMIYYIIRRNSLRRQTAMVYPGGRGVLPATMHIELQPYYLTTYDSPFIDRAQLYQTYNSAVYQLPNQFINASTTTSHLDYLNQSQPSNINNLFDVNLNRQITNSEFKSH